MEHERYKDALGSALARGGLRLVYQPVVCAKSESVYKYECLLRVYEEGVWVSAGSYIAEREKLGGLHEIDIFVLQQAAKVLTQRQDITLSVNVSNGSLSSEQWIEAVVLVAQDANVANRLIIEVTETGSLEDLNEIAKFVSVVQPYGFRVAIDDFGSGVFHPEKCSIDELANMKVNIIKIDGRYVCKMLACEASARFINAIVQFAQKHSIKTVAEFVENKSVARALREIGVDYLQGHYFSSALQAIP
ncbi:MAG: EAL domain-containing protein [Proteobacteria bacterium]|nr:EAL domain-containing protein [Pseudomonadota bacterium]